MKSQTTTVSAMYAVPSTERESIHRSCRKERNQEKATTYLQHENFIKICGYQEHIFGEWSKNTERLQNQYRAEREGEKHKKKGKKKKQDCLIGMCAGYGERRKKTMKSVLRESGKKTRKAATMLTYTPPTRPEKQRVYSKFHFPLLSAPPLSNVSFFFLFFSLFFCSLHHGTFFNSKMANFCHQKK